MTRTDIHAPASIDFDPTLYTLEGVFDLSPEFGDNGDRIGTVNALVDAGFRFASHQMVGNCGHCGAALRYVALLSRSDVNEMIYVGETCLDNRFTDMTKDQFRAIQKRAAESRAQQNLRIAFEGLLADNPELVPATYIHNVVPFAQVEALHVGWEFGTIEDILGKARKYGSISPKQVAFVAKLVAKIEAKVIAAEAAKLVPAVVNGPCPTGRIQVTGTVLSVKWVDSQYGGSEKMVVKFENGSRAYGTVPSSISSRVEKGDTVTFTAAFEESDKPDFAWFKRPSKATCVSQELVSA